jgi:hypothetical protein
MPNLIQNFYKGLTGEQKKDFRKVTVVFAILTVLFSGQLFSQLYTVDQMNKATGTVVEKEIKVTSSIGGNKIAMAKRVYSLVLTLNNRRTYNIDFNDQNVGMEDAVSKGTKVSIWYPSLTYNILSLEILNYGSRAVQFEAGGVVFDRFTSHQESHILLIRIFGGLLLFVIVAFLIWLKQVLAYNAEIVPDED